MDNELKEFLRLPSNSIYEEEKDEPYIKLPLTTKKAVELLLGGTWKDHVCKFCLNITTPLNEMDQVFKVAGKDVLYKVTIRDMFGTIYPFQLNDDPMIPDRMCNRCLNSTISSYLFAQQCDRSNRALHNCMEDIFEKFEKLDPLERPKKRGRQKTHPNPNVVYAAYENVIDYAGPVTALINRGSQSPDEENQSINPLECPRCWQDFSSLDLLLNHEKNHPKSMWYNCRICGVSFPKQTSYRRHIKDSHPDGKSLASPKKPNMNFKCDDCGFVSEDYSTHLRHVEKHKFQVTMQHVLNRKMDKLCVVCLEKNKRMIGLDKTVCLHGGYPDITGNRTLYNILNTSLPNTKPSYKYRALTVPSNSRMLKFKQKAITESKKDTTKIPVTNDCNGNITIEMDSVVEMDSMVELDSMVEVDIEECYDIEENEEPESKFIFARPIVIVNDKQNNRKYAEIFTYTFPKPNKVLDKNINDIMMNEKEDIRDVSIKTLIQPACEDLIQESPSTDINIDDDVVDIVDKTCLPKQNENYSSDKEDDEIISEEIMENHQNDLKRPIDTSDNETSDEDFEPTILKKRKLGKEIKEKPLDKELKWFCFCCLTNNVAGRSSCFSCGSIKYNISNKIININFGTENKNSELFVFGKGNQDQNKEIVPEIDETDTKVKSTLNNNEKENKEPILFNKGIREEQDKLVATVEINPVEDKVSFDNVKKTDTLPVATSSVQEEKKSEINHEIAKNDVNNEKINKPFIFNVGNQQEKNKLETKQEIITVEDKPIVQPTLTFNEKEKKSAENFKLQLTELKPVEPKVNEVISHNVTEAVDDVEMMDVSQELEKRVENTMDVNTLLSTNNFQFTNFNANNSNLVVPLVQPSVITATISPNNSINVPPSAVSRFATPMPFTIGSDSTPGAKRNIIKARRRMKKN